jgi:hypothetical protein
MPVKNHRVLSRDQRARRTKSNREYRQREQRGEVLAPVPASPDIVGLTIDLGWLPEGKADDKREIGKAIAAMLADAAKHRK